MKDTQGGVQTELPHIQESPTPILAIFPCCIPLCDMMESLPTTEANFGRLGGNCNRRMEVEEKAQFEGT